jgi:hypothetical protein
MVDFKLSTEHREYRDNTPIIPVASAQEGCSENDVPVRHATANDGLP